MFTLTKFRTLEPVPGVKVRRPVNVSEDLLPSAPKSFGEVTSAVADAIRRDLADQASCTQEPLARRLLAGLQALDLKVALTSSTRGTRTYWNVNAAPSGVAEEDLMALPD